VAVFGTGELAAKQPLRQNLKVGFMVLKRHVTLKTHELRHLAGAINNPLMVELPLLPDASWSNLVRATMRNLAERLMKKYTTCVYGTQDKVQFSFNATEIYALKTCHEHGCMDYWGDYEVALIFDILINE